MASSLYASAGPAESVTRAQERSLYRVPYNGDFSFVRVRYNFVDGGGLAAFGRRGRNRGGGDWNHDYPDADHNMAMLLDELTAMHPNTSATNVLDLEDAEIFKHPILYLSEPGFWRITNEGAKNLREYLLKGGFIIFDDFDGNGHWEDWEDQIRRVLPEYTPIEIDETHAIFDSFFFVEREGLYIPHPFNRLRPTYLGIFEDNDPTKRMMAMVNYNQDLGEFWEYAATGFFPVDPTNDAFKLGINYIIYGLTR